LEDLDPI